MSSMHVISDMHGYSDTPFLGSICKQVVSIEIFLKGQQIKGLHIKVNHQGMVVVAAAKTEINKGPICKINLRKSSIE